jgi:hypothetical protein
MLLFSLACQFLNLLPGQWPTVDQHASAQQNLEGWVTETDKYPNTAQICCV